jgi:hypothetical protein
MLTLPQVDPSELPGWVNEFEARIRRLDRRRDDRGSAKGSGLAVFIEPGEHETAAKFVQVDLVDASSCGLGVRCGVAIRRGTRFTLTVDDPRYPPITGFVVRCTKDGDTWRLGLSAGVRRAA